MKANKQSKIVVPKSGFKRSRFNWSHDVNTTYSWGEMQPTQCKLLIPGSKTTMDTQTLIRLAPMVAPTFGRVKYKTYNQFVSLAEIMPNFDAMMAQEPVSTAYATKVPTNLPSLLLGDLSTWVFQGARGTLYFAEAGTYDGQSMTAQQMADKGVYVTHYRNSPNDTSSSAYAAWQAHAINLFGVSRPFATASDVWNNAGNGVLPSIDGVVLRLQNFGTVYQSVFGANPSPSQVVLGARSSSDLCPVIRSSNAADEFFPDYKREVTMDSADFVLEGSFNYDSSDPTKVEYFALALELSDFGKRIRKILQGCGYQINLTSTAQVSILPLIATYKAYFDIFGLELYQGWETTYCAKLIKYIENNFAYSVRTNFVRSTSPSLATIDNSNLGIAFMLMEVANMWYTDDVDYVSAHLDKLAVSPAVDVGSTSGFLDWTMNGLIYGTHVNTNYGYTNPDGTNWQQQPASQISSGTENSSPAPWTDDVRHTQLDSELLKRLYKWCNRNSILGRRIAELLRAQGLGKYVDECKSNYIGSTDTIVTISDVVSTAATQDASLGEYGGKGLQYVNDKQLVFENDSYGYWITLCTVVPESGYTQGLDPTLTSLDKMNFYNPDFDAIGMEATPKWNVAHTNYIVGAVDGGNLTFGFIPRYSKFKVCSNLCNGDFNRHNMRNTYLPYTLDKQLNVNDFSVVAESYDEGQKVNFSVLNKSQRVYYMPIAGNTWRYPTKYNWLGNFDRIFLRVGQRDDADLSAVNETGVIGWSDYNPDNFLSHSIVNLQCYAPMKPIEDSYGLEEPEPNNVGVSFVTKA